MWKNNTRFVAMNSQSVLNTSQLPTSGPWFWST
jgi:hypothetical protein